MAVCREKYFSYQPPHTIHRNQFQISYRFKCEQQNDNNSRNTTGECLHDFGVTKGFFKTHETITIVENIDLLYFTKTENFCSSKDAIKKLERKNLIEEPILMSSENKINKKTSLW